MHTYIYFKTAFPVENQELLIFHYGTFSKEIELILKQHMLICFDLTRITSKIHYCIQKNKDMFGFLEPSRRDLVK